MRVIDLIEDGARQFQEAGLAFGHGTSNAFDEAVWLVLWRLDYPLDDLDSVANLPTTPAQQAQAAMLFEARIRSRKPAAYLTNEAWLQGVPFYVDERVIVPRSFIAELLVQGAIDPWLGPQTHRVLDLCTGNGSLAVLAAMAYPDIRVWGSDLSQDALEVAHINVQRHALDSRISLLQADGLSFGEAHRDLLFDLILCNPPYVNAGSMSRLPSEYLAEPALALAGGTDGMDFIRQLFRQAPAHLAAHGVLVLEIGNEFDNFDAAFPGLDVVWLESSAGEDQVLLVTAETLQGYALFQ